MTEPTLWDHYQITQPCMAHATLKFAVPMKLLDAALRVPQAQSARIALVEAVTAAAHETAQLWVESIINGGAYD